MPPIRRAGHPSPGTRQMTRAAPSVFPSNPHNDKERRTAGVASLLLEVLEVCAQRVSRCAVWVRQRGQNFFISKRSGSLRRFFLVM